MGREWPVVARTNVSECKCGKVEMVGSPVPKLVIPTVLPFLLGRILGGLSSSQMP